MLTEVWWFSESTEKEFVANVVKWLAIVEQGLIAERRIEEISSRRLTI